MTLIRWEPTRELSSLQSDFNRLFNAFFDVPAGGNGTSVRRWVPAMDLAETDLAAVIDSWDRLPEAVKAGIVAMVKAASGKGGGH